MKKQVRNIAILVVCLVVLLFNPSSSYAEETNRNQIRSELAADGWNVVYGDLINEADYARFIAAVAAAVVTENPGPIYKFFDDQLQIQITKIERNAPDIGKEALIDLLIRAFDSKGRVLRNGRLEVSADLATYKRWQRVVYDEPRTYTCWYKVGPVKTKGICTKTVQVEKEVPLPNNFQPYFRFRWVNGQDSDGTSNRPGYIFFRNNCNSPVRLALSYKNKSGQWVQKKWWNFGANERNFLNSGGQRLSSNNTYFYYYVEATDGSNRKWSGDENINFNGTTLPTKEKKLSRDAQGNWVIGIKCS